MMYADVNEAATRDRETPTQVISAESNRIVEDGNRQDWQLNLNDSIEESSGSKENSSSGDLSESGSDEPLVSNDAFNSLQNITAGNTTKQ